MFKKVLLIIIIVLSVFTFSFVKERSENIVPKIIDHMYDSIKKVRTLKMKISALERIGKGFISANSEIKLQVKPRRLYFINPYKKLEILYNEGYLSDKALVKPHIFPYVTLTLDPLGNLMRKNQHYTIHELGYDFIGKSISLTIAKDKDGLKNFSYLGKHPKNNYNCHLIQYENKTYSYVEYTVGEKETASSISMKLCVNDYLLRYKNDLLNEFGHLKKGRKLIVPNLYCKKAVLYIDEKMNLPVAISLYDDMGIFESYEYSYIEINPVIKEEEFSRTYKDYHF